MTKKITMILFALFLAACAKVEPDKDKGEELPFVDVLDVACQGSTPLGQSILNRSWKVQKLSATGFSQEDTYVFTSRGMKLSRVCKYGTVQGAVEIQASASIGADSVLIQSNEENKVDLNFKEKTYTCSVAVQSNQLIEYSFVGKCLHIKTENEVHNLTPM